MKKKIFLILAIVAVMVCALAITASAQDYEYYLVQDLEGDAALALMAEGKTNIVSVWDLYSDAENCFFANVNDGDSVVFNLAENLTTSISTNITDLGQIPGIRIEKAITVTVKFLGYCWCFTTTNNYDGFIIVNTNAKLNLIGTKAKNPDGTYKVLTTSYSEESLYEELDIYSNFVAVYMATGALYCENLAVSCNEETIYQRENYTKGYCDVSLADCSMLTRQNYCTISLNGKGNSNNDIRIDGGRYGSINLCNPLDKSYIKDATILATNSSNSLYIDSWKSRNAYNFIIENTTLEGRYYAEGDGNIIVAKNSSFTILYLKGDGSGGAYAILTDSTYSSVDFSGNKGTGKLTVIVSPDCTNNGTKTYYDINNTSGVLEEETLALGHSYDENKIIGAAYTSYLELGRYESMCARCSGGTAFEEECSALPIFENLGYSAKIGGTRITVGYMVNRESLALCNQELRFGVVAYVPNAQDGDLDNTPIGEKLTLKNPERTIFAEIEADTYVGFNFILNGFDEESYGLELIMSAFVYDGSKVYYLGASGQSEVGEVITFDSRITEE